MAKIDGLELARDMFAAYDALGWALESASMASSPDALEGVRMIRAQMRDAFAKHGLETIVPAAGEKFNPHLHEAALKCRSPFPEGRVVDVHQHGFRHGNRMIRAAKVSVSIGDP